MGVVTAWLTEMLLITYRNWDSTKSSANQPDNVAGFPLPADYLASFMVFGVLAAIPDSASKLTGSIAWGYVVATFLNLFDPANPLAKTKLPTVPATSPTTTSTKTATVTPASTPAATLI